MALFGQRDLATAEHARARRPPARPRRGRAAPDAARAVRAGLAARAGHAGPRPRRREQGRLRVQRASCSAARASRAASRCARYVDRAGHECAYYDTTLLFPTNALNLSANPTGVAVLDMSNPAKPVRTDDARDAGDAVAARVGRAQREARAARRGDGQPGDRAGHRRHLRRQRGLPPPASCMSSSPVGVLGHESGFAPDGDTFYATSLFNGSVTAVDVTNPRVPVPLWVGNYRSHGMSISQDGNRAYLAALGRGSSSSTSREVNARKPNPQVREVSRLTWPTLSIPQNALPVTIDGKPYLVEIDEFAVDEAGGPIPVGNGPRVGAGRIIDISDETDAEGRLGPAARGQPARAARRARRRPERARAPSRATPATTATSRSAVDPGIVACSFIASGLRVFDIRDPRAPEGDRVLRRAADARARRPATPSNFAMSAPAFAPDARRGLVLGRQQRLLRAAAAATASGRAAIPRARSLLGARARARAGARSRSASARRAASACAARGCASPPAASGASSAAAGTWRATIDLRGVPRRTVTVRVTARTAAGPDAPPVAPLPHLHAAQDLSEPLGHRGRDAGRGPS